MRSVRAYNGTRARRGFKLDAYVAKLAMAIERRLWAAHVEFEQEKDDWYRHGEGKTKGYVFPTCEHGTSRWTDYDNICGRCEDGVYLSDGLMRRRFAIGEAKLRVERLEKLNDVYDMLRQFGIEFDKRAYGTMMAECLDVNKFIVSISDRY